MKRIFLILLVLALGMPAFSCGGADDVTGGDTGGADDGAAVFADVTDGGQVQAPSPFTPIDADFGGYDFRILGFYSYQHMWVAVSYSEVYAETLTGVPINDAIYHRNKAVEELYNIEISLFPVSYGARSEHANIALRSIMAGDDAFDAALMIGYQMPRMMTTPNALVDLRSIQTLNLSNPWWDQASVRDLSLANKSLIVTGDISLYSAFGTVVTFFNKQMVADHHLDDPYQAVRDGTWTWNTLYEMSRAVTLDLDGDGIIDHNDQIGIMAERVSLLYSIQAGGMRLIEKDENDLPVLAGSSERLSRAIDIVLAALRGPEISMDVNTVPGDFRNPFFEWALPKFRNNEALFFYHQLHIALNLREMEADFGVLPAPKIDENQDRHFSVANEWFITYLFVPQTNIDLERTGAVLEAMGYHSQRLVTPAFYDVTVTHQLARDQDSVEMLDIILRNRVYDLGSIYNWGNIISIFGDIYNTANNDAASRFEAMEGAIEAAIQATLNILLE